MRKWHTLSVLVVSLLIATLLVPGTAAAAAKTHPAGERELGRYQGNSDSGLYAPSISADGRYVAFDSERQQPGGRRQRTASSTSSCATASCTRPSG